MGKNTMPLLDQNRVIASNGYVLIRVGKDHPLADVRGYAYEHRLVAQQRLGRPLAVGEHVHHKNGNKTDNSPDNLEVLTSPAHRVAHRKVEKSLRMPDEPNPVVTCACGCGETFLQYDDQGRPRQYVSGHNPHPLLYLDAILAALEDGPKTLPELGALYPDLAHRMKSICSKLAQRGEIKRLERGLYGQNN